MIGGARMPELVDAAHRRGLRAVLLAARDESRQAEGGAFDACRYFDIERPPSALLREILAIDARSGGVAGIVPILEFGLAPAAVAARRLGLPGTPPLAVQACGDKLRMRRALASAGLAQVCHASCETSAEAEAFRRRAGGAIIIKPTSGAGSDGVSLVDHPGGVERALALARSARGSRRVLCEGFVTGPEVSLEGYVSRGRLHRVAITDKVSDSRFLELGHSQPSRHSAADCEGAWRLAEAALAALGMVHGMCHTEVRLSPRGPVLIETHPRAGGDYIHRVTRLTTGVCLADRAVALALGEEPPAPERVAKTAAAVAYLPPRAGRVVSAALPARGDGDGIVEAGLGPLVTQGAMLSGRSASWERIAYAVAVGPTPEMALDAARRYLAEADVAIEASGTEVADSTPATARA
jgi:biotin carboxylase